VAIGRLAKDRVRAWDEFLREFAPLVLQIVHLFERHPDRVDDCFVFVCEQLKKNDLRRIRRFNASGPASFPTWLRAVVRNLCLDWRRNRFGRPRAFRAIERLSTLDQEVYRAVHLRGLTENEALETVRHSAPDLTCVGLAESLERISQSLSSRQSWLLASRRVREVPMSRRDTGDGKDGALDPADTRPGPEEQAAHGEEIEALEAALGDLSTNDRLLVRLRYEQELTLEEIARLTGLGSAATAQRTIRRALEKMRSQMNLQETEPTSVKGD